jgi:hypothetical protein
MIGIRYLNGEKSEVYLDDSWVKVGDDWYHVFWDPILFPQAM